MPRVHCFNNYLGHGKCIDMEISYYIECSKKVYVRNKRNGALSYMATTESPVSLNILPEIPDPPTAKSVLILSTRADTNKPLTASFTG